MVSDSSVYITRSCFSPLSAEEYRLGSVQLTTEVSSKIIEKISIDKVTNQFINIPAYILCG